MGNNMYPIYRAAVLLVISILCFSCRVTEDSETVVFRMEEFRTVELSYKEGEQVAIDGLEFGRPYIVRKHKDGFLFVREVKGDRQLKIIDLEEGTYTASISKGRAWNELLSLRDISMTGEEVCLSSIMENKVLRLAYDVTERAFSPDTSMSIEGIQFMRIVPFGDRYVTLSSGSSGTRMNILSETGSPVDTVGSFPTEGISGISNINNAVLQSDISVSPDLRHIVTAFRSIDYIDIYGEDFALQRRLRGPEQMDIELKSEKAGPGGYRFTQEPKFVAYDNVVSDAEGFYAGYYGIEMPRPGARREQGFRTILSFDWAGHPGAAYMFDTPVISFDVDRLSGEMYCLMETAEPEIRIFRIL